MARPVIALLTDFGLRDHYAGTMKGVALGICPDATLVDLSHDIPPHDVMDGALELAASYRYFPQGTVFLVVIDPGVGTARRGIAVDAGGYRFVAPDNGVLSIALDDLAAATWRPASDGRSPAADARVDIVELSNAGYALPAISRTFEGRDRFAPAAARLALGTPLADLGRAVPSLQRLDMPRAHTAAQAIDAEILRVDRFGNLTTNIDRATFSTFSTLSTGAAVGDTGTLSIRIGDCVLTKIVSTYAEVAAGELCALFGSWDRLEIAANGADASRVLQAGRGTRVRVYWGSTPRDNIARL